MSAPWSLNDRKFTYCMLYSKTGRPPDENKSEKHFLSPTEQIVAGKVEDTLKKKALEYLQNGAIVLGGAAIETFFKVKGSTLGGLALDTGWSLLSHQLGKMQLADLTARRCRRDTAHVSRPRRAEQLQAVCCAMTDPSRFPRGRSLTWVELAVFVMLIIAGNLLAPPG